MSEALETAISNNDLEALKALLQAGASLEAPLRVGTPLATALVYHRWELADYLLQAGASPHIRIYNHYTPLTWLAMYGQVPLFQRLLDLGCDPAEPDSQGKNALHWAAETGQLEILPLLQAIPIDQQPPHQPTALWLACQRGQLKTAGWLIAHGASLTATDNQHNTLLHAAVQSGQPEMLRLLLTPLSALLPEQGAAAPVPAARNWLTALLAQIPALERLLAQRPAQNQLPDGPQPTAVMAQLLEQRNQQRQTPLQVAASLGQVELVKILLQAGAAPDDSHTPAEAPIVQAAASGHVPSFEALLKVARFEPEQQALALQQAIQRRQLTMLQRLLPWAELQAPLSARHPLGLALEANHTDTIRLLLQAGADANSHWKGKPLLRYATDTRNEELARLLIQQGATVGREAAQNWLDQLLLLRKTASVQLPVGSGSLPAQLLLGLQRNLDALGFVMTPELAERVLTLSENEVKAFYDWLVPALRQWLGADRPYKPMYPHFPAGVKAMDPAELYLNALLHYWGDSLGLRILPEIAQQPRPDLDAALEPLELRPLGLAGPEALEQLFGKLLQARSALQPEDKALISWVVATRKAATPLPAEVPLRENAALLGAALLRYTELSPAAYLKNTLDVLRLATALMEGDVSLAENTRFRRLSKATRRFLLSQLERMQDLEEGLWRQPEKFKRLGECLHPGAYQQRYPRTAAAFAALRQGQRPPGYARRVELALAEGQLTDILPLLQTRPGDFARRLDHLLRRAGSAEAEATVLAAFDKVVNQLPSPLLLQLQHHFGQRGQASPTPLRVFFPKGNLAKLQAIENKLPALEPSLCQQVQARCQQALRQHYAQRPPLGPCYLDPALQHYHVPFALRSASKALKTVARGSRVQLAEGQTADQAGQVVRFFIWWRDGRERTDLDLSALALGPDFSYHSTLAYYNLVELGGCHSGDITSAPEGASEFIDIEIETCLQQGIRYVMMVVNSFTSQPYADLPECFAGFMLRQQADSGEIYEPRTVKNRFDLSADSTIAMPLILDLQERSMIWADLSLKQQPNTANNVYHNRSSLGLLCEAMVQLRKPTLYELFALHIDARGTRVYDRQQAETVFAVDTGLTPWDSAEIIATFL